VQVVLERIRDPAAAESDVRRPVMLENLVPHHVIEEGIELAEMAENHVAAHVPGKPLRITDRGSQAPNLFAGLENHPIGVAERLQLPRTRQPARPRPDDYCPLTHASSVRRGAARIILRMPNSPTAR
jgi:hypothetical protein